ncbi:hypothetical protein KIL84_017206 [Mauremys mutica]|uniref:Uncharacterized protein n=1 Tax=Mauremys mutica TaxID=74926 RepID=A0A9D4ARF5_9SAUR|nr:hypothetical protein KIL84_017206 [Mauremys mutica]
MVGSQAEGRIELAATYTDKPSIPCHNKDSLGLANFLAFTTRASPEHDPCYQSFCWPETFRVSGTILGQRGVSLSRHQKESVGVSKTRHMEHEAGSGPAGEEGEKMLGNMGRLQPCQAESSWGVLLALPYPLHWMDLLQITGELRHSEPEKSYRSPGGKSKRLLVTLSETSWPRHQAAAPRYWFRAVVPHVGLSIKGRGQKSASAHLPYTSPVFPPSPNVAVYLPNIHVSPCLLHTSVPPYKTLFHTSPAL